MGIATLIPRWSKKSSLLWSRSGFRKTAEINTSPTLERDMPKHSDRHRNDPSKSRVMESGKKESGDFSPTWLKKSRDDVPLTNQPLPENPLVAEIMGVGNPSNVHTDQTQDPKPKQTSSEEEV